jgi:hypothetical protein
MRQIGSGIVILAVVSILLGVATACVVGRGHEKGTSVAKTCEPRQAAPARTVAPKQEPTLAPPRPACAPVSPVGQRQVIEIRVEAEQVSPDAAGRK